MNFEDLLRLYRQGAIVNIAFVPEVLACLNEDNVDAVLNSVPPEAAHDLVAFLREIDPAAPSFSFGPVRWPSPAQIAMARRWLIRKRGDASTGETESA